jgi:hypothetical protein
MQFAAPKAKTLNSSLAVRPVPGRKEAAVLLKILKRAAKQMESMSSSYS